MGLQNEEKMGSKLMVQKKQMQQASFEQKKW